MDRVTPEIEQLFRAKDERRARLAVLPFHEKVQAIVRMQQMAAPIQRARGKQVRGGPFRSLNPRESFFASFQD